MTKRTRLTLFALVFSLLVALPACGNEEAAAWKEVAPAQRAATDAVPQPSGKPVLVVTGSPTRNTSDNLAVSLDTLKQLRQVEFTVFEPAQQKDLTFQGFPVSDLLSVLGLASESRTLVFRALDDYHVEFKSDELVDQDAIISIYTNGKEPSVAEGGPIRLVFPTGSKLGKNADNWIWSIDRIEVQ